MHLVPRQRTLRLGGEATQDMREGDTSGDRGDRRGRPTWHGWLSGARITEKELRDTSSFPSVDLQREGNKEAFPLYEECVRLYVEIQCELIVMEVYDAETKPIMLVRRSENSWQSVYLDAERELRPTHVPCPLAVGWYVRQCMTLHRGWIKGIKVRPFCLSSFLSHGPLMMWIRSYACMSVCRYILYVSNYYFAKGRELKSAPSATSVFPSPPPCDTRTGISARFHRIMSSLGFNSNHCLTLLGR